MIDKRSEAAVR